MATEFTYKDLAVLYEDNHVIVVVKPCNIPSQADSSGDKDMLTIVKEYLINKYDKVGDAYVGLIHRLDRPTGGVMVFAKTSKSASRLSEEIKSGEFEKKYLCVTCGVPKQRNGQLKHYLKKNQAKNIVQIVPQATDGAKLALLDYSFLQEVKGFSLFKIALHTGRSHQIRVQMASLGLPLFGDSKYGALPATFKHNLGLWATEVKFIHPTTKETMTFIVHPPKDEVPWRAYDIARLLNVGIASNPYDDLANFNVLQDKTKTLIKEENKAVKK
ncbi:MAG: RluA family pseudouridine synthase [Clostridia bacterium]|nr:RluA family pseudouridine synthase [Clostridia bacterium]